MMTKQAVYIHLNKLLSGNKTVALIIFIYGENRGTNKGGQIDIYLSNANSDQVHKINLNELQDSLINSTV